MRQMKNPMRENVDVMSGVKAVGVKKEKEKVQGVLVVTWSVCR